MFDQFWLSIFLFQPNRHRTKRSHREVFCFTDLASSGESGQDWKSPSAGERGKGNKVNVRYYVHRATSVFIHSHEHCINYVSPQDSTIRLDYVNTGPLQHLPAAVPRHVHLCHFWHVLLHERQAQGDTRWSLQLRDVLEIHDPAVSGIKLHHFKNLADLIISTLAVSNAFEN